MGLEMKRWGYENGSALDWTDHGTSYDKESSPPRTIILESFEPVLLNGISNWVSFRGQNTIIAHELNLDCSLFFFK